MKTKTSVLWALLALFCFIVALVAPAATALAQDPATTSAQVATSPADTVAQVAAPLVSGLVASHPWIATVLVVMGALRVVCKPIMAVAHAYTAATASPNDDIVVDKIEASWIWRAICWVLDWGASIKVGTQKPVATAGSTPSA